MRRFGAERAAYILRALTPHISEETGELVFPPVQHRPSSWSRPAEAILPDTESGLEKWLELNTSFSAEWPNITRKKDSPADADEHKGEEGKYDKYFTPDPGAGD